MGDQFHLKLWEALPRLSKSKEVHGNISHHGFTKNKLYLNGTEHLCDEGRLDLKAKGGQKILLTWTLACGMLPHSIFISQVGDNDWPRRLSNRVREK